MKSPATKMMIVFGVLVFSLSVNALANGAQEKRELPQDVQSRSGTIVITVEGEVPADYFEHYIFMKTRQVSLCGLMDKDGQENRLEAGLERLVESLPGAIDPSIWKQDHIGVAVTF